MAPNRLKQQEIKAKKNEKSHSVSKTIDKKKVGLRSEQREKNIEGDSSKQQNRKCKIAVKPISKKQTEK